MLMTVGWRLRRPLLCCTEAALLVGAVAAASPSTAQDVPAAPAAVTPQLPADPPAPPAPAPCCTVLGGTLITISIDKALDSKTARVGQEFPIHLAEPLVQGEATLIPAGTPGVGEVIHVAHAGLMGRPGELSVVVRHLTLDGRAIPLRGFQLGGAGKNNTDLALVVNATVGIVGVFISGGNKYVPLGTLGTAKIAVDTTLSPVGPAPTPTTNPKQEDGK